MKDKRDWGEVNAEYLSAAVDWVRQRLQRASEGPSELKDPKDPKELKAAKAAAKFPKPAGAMAILADRFHLTVFDQQILVLAAAAELDTEIPALCAQLQGDRDQRFPTFALPLALFEESAWESLTPAGPLRFWRLIEVQNHGHSITGSQIRIDERILHFLKGIQQIDAGLGPFVIPVATEQLATLAPSHVSVVNTILERWETEAGSTTPIYLTGADPSAKELIALHASAAAGKSLYRISADLLPSAPMEMEMFARLWQRDATLASVALYIDAEDQDLANTPVGQTVDRLLSNLRTTVFLGCVEPSRRPSSRGLVLRIQKPERADQRAAWIAALSGDTETAELLAGQFNLNLSDIARIESYAHPAKAVGKEEFRSRLWSECVRSLDPRINDLASEVQTHSTWDDIVLPPAELELLHSIASHVKHRTRVHIDWGYERKLGRGLGVSALFVGPSGVGKTRAAEILANELHLALYRVDLSAVMSKYIGEAEKHLRRIFDAAEDGGAILFFDEADALFGKRTEIKDHQDRYGNVEVNYLLQRMEAFRGLAILASNMKQALDFAFTRRLHYIINFPFPGPAERRRLWMRAFPPETPVHELDFDRLSNFTITGGTIQNIALQAAFRAAEKGSHVNMETVLAATRTEFKKIDRLFSEAEFQIPGKSGAAA
jgi:ATPase family associated with various cellular activities (AAA)